MQGVQTQLKDITSVFKEKMEAMPKLINEDKFQNCQNICRDLIRTSWTLELKDELFIGEVLEGVFDQINTIVTEYEVPEQITKSLGDVLKKQIDELIKFYTTRNVTGLYNCLREIRYSASHYQLITYQNYTEKESDIPMLRRRIR